MMVAINFIYEVLIKYPIINMNVLINNLNVKKKEFKSMT